MTRYPSWTATLTVLLLMGLATLALAANRGVPTFDIFGGTSGKVPFPHRRHQERIPDCAVCHSVFPQEVDAMKKMKTAGTLKPKRVMNLQCIQCHRQDKQAGRPHGPLTCNTCHIP